jgi:hypothetical protein
MTENREARQLPASPSISHIKKQAKTLKKVFLSGDPVAAERVAGAHPDPSNIGSFTLRDAQATIAREYGFGGWHQLITAVGEQMVEERDLHKWFGVQLNNGVWVHIADPSFGPASPLKEREDALYSAYASAYHWRNAGNEANWARGEHLISRVATKVGEFELGKKHAQRCLILVAAHPESMADWDAPFGHEALARALAGLGQTSQATKERNRAMDLTAAVQSEGDRQVLESELRSEPWFGLVGQ